MIKTDGLRAEFEHAENDGKRESSRTDRARIEDEQTAVASDERHMRVAANNNARAVALGLFSGVSPKLWAIDTNVTQQDDGEVLAVSGRHPNIDGVGKFVGPGIDVSADDDDGGDGFKRPKRFEASDIARMKNGVGFEVGDEIWTLRMRLAVGVGDDRNADSVIMTSNDFGGAVRPRSTGFEGSRFGHSNDSWPPYHKTQASAETQRTVLYYSSRPAPK